ncbi:hypothetical protein NQ314_009022 [Rhamnusium bicolor]|uniref:Uncharacterized protein n=1 Tax=Rhamnusium bicolor TaxID=1586634 RepID=A0AAV8Y2Z0_9CUCU|nr:hypothetical protein NQ314_009022 [Rhamnusium bicolor]
MSNIERLNKYAVLEIRTEKGRQKMERIFLEAVAQSNVKTVEACLLKGIDPNALDEDKTALHIAAVKGDMPIGELLLKHPKTDINQRNSIGITPLMFACIYQRRKFVQTLLTHGAKVNSMSDKGKTALHFSCIQNNMGITYDLMSRGANVNAVDVFDNTPLSTVVIDYPSLSIARFLLRKGANATKTREFPLFLVPPENVWLLVDFTTVRFSLSAYPFCSGKRGLVIL